MSISRSCTSQSTGTNRVRSGPTLESLILTLSERRTPKAEASMSMSRSTRLGEEDGVFKLTFFAAFRGKGKRDWKKCKVGNQHLNIYQVRGFRISCHLPADHPSHGLWVLPRTSPCFCWVRRRFRMPWRMHEDHAGNIRSHHQVSLMATK